MSSEIEEFCKGFLYCPLCLSYSTVEPVELLCSGRHIFCFSCLYSYQEHNPTLPCPICRTGEGVISNSRTVKAVAKLLVDNIHKDEKEALASESKEQISDTGNVLKTYLELLPHMKIQQPGLFKSDETNITPKQLNYFRRFAHLSCNLKVPAEKVILTPVDPNIDSLREMMKIRVDHMKFMVCLIKPIKKSSRRKNYESMVLPMSGMVEAMLSVEQWRFEEGALEPVIFVVTAPAPSELPKDEILPHYDNFFVLYQRTPIPLFFHTTLVSYLTDTFMMSHEYLNDFMDTILKLYSKMEPPPKA